MEESEELGGWAWSWKADLDENTRTDVRGRTWQEGHRVVSEAVADDAKVHVDRFDETAPDGLFDDATSLILSRAVAKDLQTYGGSAFEDKDLGKEVVLERLQEREVQIRADDGLWSIPAWVTATNDGEGVYVVAADLDAPLVLSASRPGWHMRLMAVASRPLEPRVPASED